MTAIDKFFQQIFKANKKFVEDRWAEWQAVIQETLKADLEKKYPDGFKDFLVEKIEIEIENSK